MIEKITNEIIKFIINYYSKNNLKGVVISISGEEKLKVNYSDIAKVINNEPINMEIKKE